MPIFDRPGGLGASTLTERNQPLSSGNLEDVAARLITQNRNPAEYLKLRQADIENRIRASQAESQARNATTNEQNQALDKFKFLMSLAGEGIINVDKAIPLLTEAAKNTNMTLDENSLRDMFSQPGNTVQAISAFQQLQQQGIPRDQAATQIIQQFPQSKAIRQLLDPIALEKSIQDTPSTLSAARLVTGRANIRTLQELTPDEQNSVELYTGASTQLKEILNELRLRNPGKSITELYPQAQAQSTGFTLQKQRPVVVSTGDMVSIVNRKGEIVKSFKENLNPSQVANYDKLILEARQSDLTLKQLDKTLPLLNLARIPEEAPGRGLSIAIGTRTGLNQDAKLFKDRLGLVVTNLSRSIGGERGVLTDQDRGVAEIATADIYFDTEQTVRSKLSLLRQLNDQRINGLKMIRDGINPETIRNDSEVGRKIDEIIGKLGQLSSGRTHTTTTGKHLIIPQGVK